MPDEPILDPELVARLDSASRRTDLAYAAIRDAIARGRIRPGDWLRQETLADELRVSQVTVRAALSRIVADGLAVHVPYRGVRAVLLPIEELEDVYELRAVLEGFAFRLAADRLSAAELAQMRKLLPATVVDAAPDSVDGAWTANWDFHMIAIRASGRRHLARILEQLMHLTNPYVLLSVGSDEARLAAAAWELEAHSAIVDALAARDGKLAETLIAEHLLGALDTLRQSFASDAR